RGRAWLPAAQIIWPLVARACIVSVMANDPFRALAHPTRRAIVERLARGAGPLGEGAGGLGGAGPADPPAVEGRGGAGRGGGAGPIEGRPHRIGLDLDALAGGVGWLDRQRAIWERMFDVVGDFLEEQEKAR